MTIRRLFPTAIDVVCACGAPATHELANLEVMRHVVPFPMCTACGVRQTTVAAPVGPANTAQGADVLARTRAIKGLCVQLAALGRASAQRPMTAGVEVDALPWPTEGAVEVPLAADFATAYAAWQAAHPQGRA